MAAGGTNVIDSSGTSDVASVPLKTPPVAFLARWSSLADLVAVLLVVLVKPVLSHALFSTDLSQRPDGFSLIGRILLADVPMDIGLAIMIMLLLKTNPSYPQPRPTPRSEFKKEAIAGVALGVGSWGLILGARYVLHRLGVPGRPTYWHYLLAGPETRLVFCATDVFNAGYEEVAFRAFLQSRLQSLMRGATVLPIAISAVVFAVGHGYSLAPTIGVLIFGIAQGIVYIKWRRIPRLVIGHWLHNVLITWIRF